MKSKPSPEQQKRSAVALATLILQSDVGLTPHRNRLLSTCVWKWTEAYGKYQGCRYWTREALRVGDRRQLHHEHVVPRKWIVRAWNELDAPDEESVREILARHAVACVATREEHGRLGRATWEELVRDPWCRYTAVGIHVVDTWEV